MFVLHFLRQEHCASYFSCNLRHFTMLFKGLSFFLYWILSSVLGFKNRNLAHDKKAWSMAGNDVIGSMIFEGKSPFSRAILPIWRASERGDRRRGSKIWLRSCFAFFSFLFFSISPSILFLYFSKGTHQKGKSKGVPLCAWMKTGANSFYHPSKIGLRENRK